MSAPDISAVQTSIVSHVTTAVGATNWTIKEGAPRGYVPPQINIWWMGLRAGAPMEVQEIPYQWTIRMVAESADDPSRQDICAAAWEAIFNEWATSDAISCGGAAQLSYPSAVDPIEVETEGMLYPGYDITLTVVIKKARVFTFT